MGGVEMETDLGAGKQQHGYPHTGRDQGVGEGKGAGGAEGRGAGSAGPGDAQAGLKDRASRG